MTDADLARQASALDAYGRANLAESYAGVRLDRAAGCLVALFVGDAERHARLLREDLALTAPLRVEPAAFPLRVLEAVRGRVSADRPALRDEGVTIVGLSVDVRLNRVAVGLAEPTAAAAELLERRYGAAVAVRSGPARAELR